MNRLCLIDWDNNKDFNVEYLNNFKTKKINCTQKEKTDEIINDMKAKLDIKANTILPLTYSGHISLLMFDNDLKCYQFNTGLERKEFKDVEDLCKITQRGQCCGFSIHDFVVANKNNFDLNGLMQGDKIINRKINEFEDKGAVDITDKLKDIYKNIKDLTKYKTDSIEAKEKYYNTCHELCLITHVRNNNIKVKDSDRDLKEIITKSNTFANEKNKNKGIISCRSNKSEKNFNIDNVKKYLVNELNKQQKKFGYVTYKILSKTADERMNSMHGKFLLLVSKGLLKGLYNPTIQNNDAQDKNLAHQENIKKRDGFSQKY